jgi:hypothetical protein
MASSPNLPVAHSQDNPASARNHEEEFVVRNQASSDACTCDGQQTYCDFCVEQFHENQCRQIEEARG